jgi:hypothetical protein
VLRTRARFILFYFYNINTIIKSYLLLELAAHGNLQDVMRDADVELDRMTIMRMAYEVFNFCFLKRIIIGVIQSIL